MNHSEARSGVCVCCGVKIPLKYVKKHPMTPSLENKIRHHCKPEFDSRVVSYPNGCCSTCQRALYKVAKGEKMSMGIKESWNKFQLDQIPHLACGRDENCSCKLCELGKFNKPKSSY